MDAPHTAPQLPARTTPTWEVELLISGVAVFAMLQLPGWLDLQAFAVLPRLEQNWAMPATMFYIYAKSAAILLALTFAVHLLLRAQWIALVGIHSVFPLGIRMDRLRMGPLQRAVEERRQEPAGVAIERADNRASVVFAIGVTIAIMLGVISLVVCTGLVAATLIAHYLGLRVDAAKLVMSLFAVVMVPFSLAMTFDWAFGARLAPGGLPHRMLARIIEVYARIGMSRRNNRIIAVLSSNGGERRIMMLVMVVIMATVTGVSVSFAAMRRSGPLGNYASFPGDVAVQVDAAHYDDQRDPSQFPGAPFVQSLVVSGPYLKLLVPYSPRRDGQAMETCKLPPTDDREGRAQALLACLQALRPVTLDGALLQGLRYEVASDPRNDRPALLAMIDVRRLPPGRHELRVARAPRTMKPDEDDDPGDAVDVIPFWR